MPSESVTERSLIPRAGRSNSGTWDVEVDGGPAEEGQVTELKDGRLAWTVCAAGFLLQVLIVGMLHVFGVFFVEFVREFKKTKGEIAWIGSAAYGLSMAFGPITGMLVKRYGNRPVTMAGCLICAVSALVSSFASTVEMLFLSYSLLYGIGTSLAYTPTMTIAQDYFDKYVSVATGIMTAGSSTGTLVLAPLTQYLVDSYGWRVAFRFFTGTCLFTVCCAMMFKPLTRKPAQPTQRIRKSPLTRLIRELGLWKDRAFIVWVVGVTLVMFGYYIPYVHLVSYAKEVGVPPDQGSMLVMLLGGSTAVGRVMFGKIVQYGFLDRLHMHQLSMVITGTGAMILPLITSFGGLAAYVVCVGLVDGCFVVLLPLMTATLVGSKRTVVAWGFLVGASSLTFTLGPPVAGWINDYTGSYNIAFHVAGVPIILGALVLFLIPWAKRTSTRSNVLAIVDVEATRDSTDPPTRKSPVTTPLSSPMCGTHPTSVPLTESSRCFSIGSVSSTRNISLTMTNLLDNSYHQLWETPFDDRDALKPQTKQSRPLPLAVSKIKASPMVAASLPANLNHPLPQYVSDPDKSDTGQMSTSTCSKTSSATLQKELFLRQKQLMSAAGRVRAKSWSESGQRYREIHMPQTTKSERHRDLMSFEARSQMAVDHGDKLRGLFGQSGPWRYRETSSSDLMHESATSAVSSDRNYLADVSQQPSENSLVTMFDSFGMTQFGCRERAPNSLLNGPGASTNQAFAAQESLTSDLLTSQESLTSDGSGPPSLPSGAVTSSTHSPHLLDLSDTDQEIPLPCRQKLTTRLSSSTSPTSSQEKLPTINENKPFYVTESMEGTGSDRIPDAVSDLVQKALLPSGGEG